MALAMAAVAAEELVVVLVAVGGAVPVTKMVLPLLALPMRRQPHPPYLPALRAWSPTPSNPPQLHHRRLCPPTPAKTAATRIRATAGRPALALRQVAVPSLHNKAG